MIDYKGVYYNDNDNDKKFFEFGAHFKYKDLVKILLNLGGKFLELPNIENSNKKSNNKNFINFSNENKTRNKILNQFKFSKTKIKPFIKSLNNENYSQLNLISNFNIKNSNYNFNKYFIKYNNKNLNDIFHSRNNSNMNNDELKKNINNFYKHNNIKSFDLNNNKIPLIQKSTSSVKNIFDNNNKYIFTNNNNNIFNKNNFFNNNNNFNNKLTKINVSKSKKIFLRNVPFNNKIKSLNSLLFNSNNNNNNKNRIKI